MDYLYDSTPVTGTLTWLNIRAGKGKFAQLDKSNTYKFYQGFCMGNAFPELAQLDEVITFTTDGAIVYSNPSFNTDLTEQTEVNGDNIRLLENVHTVGLNPPTNITTWWIDISEFVNRPRKQGRIRFKIKGNFSIPSAFAGGAITLHPRIIFQNSLDFEHAQGQLNSDTQTLSTYLNPIIIGNNAGDSRWIEMDFNAFISSDTTVSPWDTRSSGEYPDKWFFKIAFIANGTGMTAQTPYTVIVSQLTVKISFADDPDTEPYRPFN